MQMATLLGQIHLPDEADPTSFAYAYHILNAEYPLTPNKIVYGVTVLRNTLEHQCKSNLKNESANLKAVQTLVDLISRMNVDEPLVTEAVAKTLRLYLLGTCDIPSWVTVPRN